MIILDVSSGSPFRVLIGLYPVRRVLNTNLNTFMTLASILAEALVLNDHLEPNEILHEAFFQLDPVSSAGYFVARLVASLSVRHEASGFP